MIRRGLGALLLTCVVGAAAAAEEKRARPDIDLFSVESRFFPRLSLEDPTPNSAEENARVHPRPVRLRVALPWRKKTETSSLSAAVSYERIEFGLDGWDAVDAFPRGPFHSVQLSLSYARTLPGDRWGLRAFLTPGVSSDFHGSAADGFRLQGGAFWEKKNRGGALSLGLVLINDYGTPRVFPGIAWSGEIADRQTVVVRLPILLSWSYQATETFDWGVAARVAGGNYEIGRDGPFKDHELKYSAGTVGPFVRKKMGDWSVGVETGYVFVHDLEVRRRRHQIRDYDLDRSAFTTLTVRLAL